MRTCGNQERYGKAPPTAKSGMNPRFWQVQPHAATRRKAGPLTGKVRLAVCLLLVLLVGAGCISRTVTRSRRLTEMASKRGSNVDDKGNVVETRFIWIWQPEFWHH